MERKECRDRQERKVGSGANKYVHNIIHSEFRGSKTTEFTLVILLITFPSWHHAGSEVLNQEDVSGNKHLLSLVFKPLLIISWKNYSRKVARELPRHILFPRTALPKVKFDIAVAVARRQGGIPRMNEPWQDLGQQTFSCSPGWVPRMSIQTCSCKRSFGGSSQTVPLHHRVCPRRESDSTEGNTHGIQKVSRGTLKT